MRLALLCELLLLPLLRGGDTAPSAQPTLSTLMSSEKGRGAGGTR